MQASDVFYPWTSSLPLNIVQRSIPQLQPSYFRLLPHTYTALLHDDQITDLLWKEQRRLRLWYGPLFVSRGNGRKLPMQILILVRDIAYL